MGERFEKADALVLPDWIGMVDVRAREIAIEDGFPTTRLLVADNPCHDYIASWKPRIELQLKLGVDC